MTETFELSCDGGETWTPATKAQYVSAERSAGFRNTLGEPDEPATSGWSSGSFAGRMAFLRPAAETGPHLIPIITDRGFSHMPPIDGTYDGHQVQVKAFESSAASEPCLWLKVADGERKATVHLTVESALRLADQIRLLATNHYQLTEEGGHVSN